MVLSRRHGGAYFTQNMASQKDIPKRTVEPADIFLIVICAASAGACVVLKGWDSVVNALTFMVTLIAQIAPIMLISILMAAFVQVLLPHDIVSKWLGRESGFRGILIATAAGAVIPGGPWVSFPLVLALAVAGADIGALVAFLSAWAVIPISRLLVWEMPFLGGDFVLIRMLVSSLIPLAAGIIARHIPLTIDPPGRNLAVADDE